MSSCCEHDHDEQDSAAEEHDEHAGHGGGAERLIDVASIRASILAGLLLGAGLLAGRLDTRTVATVLLAGALVVGGWTFVPETLRGLLRGRLGVGTLMTIAAVGAVLLGELGEAATLAFLFSIAEGLEAYSLAKTRRGLRALLALVPERATVLRDGREVEVAPAELRVGERMLLRPGERAATDGVVRAGRSTLDVSAITGESIPVEAGPGEVVYAGAINGGGALEVEVTAASEDNSLAHSRGGDRPGRHDRRITSPWRACAPSRLHRSWDATGRTLRPREMFSLRRHKAT